MTGRSATIMSESISLPSNKVCVVVGVGEGLGRGSARRFAAGYKVALVARSAEVVESDLPDDQRENNAAAKTAATRSFAALRMTEEAASPRAALYPRTR